MHLYHLFKDFVSFSPITYELTDRNTRKKRLNISFDTLALLYFNEFYELFYINNVKTITNNIKNYFILINLTFRIMVLY